MHSKKSLLGSSKAIEATYIPVKVIKGNSIFFLQNKYALILMNLSVKENSEIIFSTFNNTLSKFECGF